jgi:hypothetical protein
VACRDSVQSPRASAIRGVQLVAAGDAVCEAGQLQGTQDRGIAVGVKHEAKVGFLHVPVCAKQGRGVAVASAESRRGRACQPDNPPGLESSAPRRRGLRGCPSLSRIYLALKQDQVSFLGM